MQPLAACLLLLRAARVVAFDLERQTLASASVPLAEAEVLVQLAAAPRRTMTISHLAQEIHLSRSGASRIVDRLELRSLAVRATSPGDGRSVLAALTERGWEVTGPLLRALGAAARQTLCPSLSADELEVLTQILAELVASTMAGGDLGPATL